MIPTLQHEILGKLGRIFELSPGVRVGQLMAHLDFLADDMFDRGLGDVDDDQLIKVLERHEAELARRETNVA